MPPASLSTLAVIMPGPITARAAARRVQREAERARSARAPPCGVVARAPASAMQHLLQHVVDGDDAEEAAVRVLHGEREEVVLRGLLGDLPDRIVGIERRGMLVHETEDEYLGLRDDDVAEREDSGKLAVRTDHERVVQMRNRLSLAAHLLEGLRRAELRLEPEELGVHEAAGGVLAVGKKLLDLARLARLHLGEELRGFLLGQIGEQVGGVVRLHL